MKRLQCLAIPFSVMWAYAVAQSPETPVMPVSSQEFQQSTPSTSKPSRSVGRDEISLYVEQCIKEQQIEIERLRAMHHPSPEKQERLAALRTRPYYARLHVDLEPHLGAIGVLSDDIAAKVIHVRNGSEMLCELTWQGDTFNTFFSRRVVVQGIKTKDFKVDSTIPLPGVFKVSQKTKYEATDGDTEEDVPVLYAVDISRHVEDAFYATRRKAQTYEAAPLKAEIDVVRAKEAAAENWLRVAKEYLAHGERHSAAARFERIMEAYPDTEAAKAAEELLNQNALGSRKSGRAVK